MVWIRMPHLLQRIWQSISLTRFRGQTSGIGVLLLLQRQAVAIEHVGHYFTDVVDAGRKGRGGRRINERR